MRKNFELFVFTMFALFFYIPGFAEEIPILVHKSEVGRLRDIMKKPEAELLDKEANKVSLSIHPIQESWGTGYILYENELYNRYAGISGTNLIRVGVKQVAHWAPYRGFAKFDITIIPSNATINSITLHTYTYEASPSSNHRVNIKRLNLDPAGSNLSAIFTAINDLASSAYFYNNYNALSSGQTGDRSAVLNNNAVNDLQAKINNGQSWWALGFIETPNENEIFGSFRGRDQNTPYIIVDYSVPPTANFYGSPTSGVAPLTVDFTNTSSGTITGYSWDFGDGTSSTSKNPRKTYSTPGEYTVRLTATGPGGSNTRTRTNYITVTQPSGDINVTVRNIDNSSVPLPGNNGSVRLYNNNWQYLTQASTNSSGVATFSNRPFATYNIEAYHTPNDPPTIFGAEFWGNTNFSHNTNPTPINFVRHMPHFVHAKVYNNSNNQEITGGTAPLGTQLKILVRLRNPNSVSMSVRPRLIIDKSKSTKYDYDETADAVIISGNNTTRDYTFYYTPTNSGDYYCIVGTETNIEGSFIITDGAPWENNPIVSIIGIPVANFYGTPTSGDAPLTVNFTNTTTGEITNYLWDFGDGTSSTSTNPTKTYSNPGTYTVQLTASGPGGDDTRTRTNYITVYQPTGSLSVTVNNIPGGDHSLPGNNGVVKLWNSGGDLIATTSTSNNVASFDNMPAGDGYFYRVFHNTSATMFGEEFWGDDGGVTITAGNTTFRTFVRNMPHSVWDSPGNPNVYTQLINMTTGEFVTWGEVSPGTPLEIRLTAKNPNNSPQSVKKRMVLKRDGSVVKDETSGSVSITSNGTLV